MSKGAIFDPRNRAKRRKALIPWGLGGFFRFSRDLRVPPLVRASRCTRADGPQVVDSKRLTLFSSSLYKNFFLKRRQS